MIRTLWVAKEIGLTDNPFFNEPLLIRLVELFLYIASSNQYWQKE